MFEGVPKTVLLAVKKKEMFFFSTAIWLLHGQLWAILKEPASLTGF